MIPSRFLGLDNVFKDENGMRDDYLYAKTFISLFN